MFVCNVRCPMDFSSQRIASFQSVDAITHLYFVCCAETRAMDTFFPQMPTSRSGTPDRRWIFLSAIEQRIQNLPDPKLTLLSSIRERVPRAREPQRQRVSDRKLMLFSSEIFTASCSRERVRRARDFVLRQGKILPVEGVYIAVLDRHRAIF